MSIELILGPMFSGKTTEMFRRVRRRAAAGETCMVIKWHKDGRYSDTDAVTHDFMAMPAATAARLADVDVNTTVVGVDEGQFYPDLYDTVLWWQRNGVKHIIIATLDGTYEQKPFDRPLGQAIDLIPRAESVTKLTAICATCGADAPFTRRLDQTNVQEVAIGGADMYAASCRTCLARPLLKTSVDAQQERLKMLQSK